MLSVAEDVMRIHVWWLFWIGGAWAQDLTEEVRTERQVTLFQSAVAELEDRYVAATGSARLVDLPGAPVLGSCAFPEADIERVDYPRQGLNLALGQSVQLWVRDERLGSAFQTARVAWRQPPSYGFQLSGGQTLPWQPGSDWAQLIQPPESYPGLDVSGQWQDALIVRCAIPGPTWQAVYQGVLRDDQLDLSLNAQIQVPSAQNWGDVELSLSAEVGRPERSNVLRAELASAGDSQVVDGVWRYRFADTVLLYGGQQFTRRLWRETAQIERVHQINTFVSAQNQDQQSLPAQRVWYLENSQAAGLGIAMPAGSIRINEQTDTGYPLAGRAYLPALAPGARHAITLGPSLGVSGRLERNQMTVQGARIDSTWRLVLENTQDAAVEIELNLQTQRDAVLSGDRPRIRIPAESREILTLRLSEPRR